MRIHVQQTPFSCYIEPSPSQTQHASRLLDHNTSPFPGAMNKVKMLTSVEYEA